MLEGHFAGFYVQERTAQQKQSLHEIGALKSKSCPTTIHNNNSNNNPIIEDLSNEFVNNFK